MRLKHFGIYWGPVILWVALIFLLSTQVFASSHTSRIIEPMLRFLMPDLPLSTIHHIHGVTRKLSHVTEYFVLGLLLFRVFRSEASNMKTWRWAINSMIVLIIIAFTDEFHQSLVVTRTASFIDVGIDMFGGFLAQCAILVREHWQKKDEQPVQK